MIYRDLYLNDHKIIQGNEINYDSDNIKITNQSKQSEESTSTI